MAPFVADLGSGYAYSRVRCRFRRAASRPVSLGDRELGKIGYTAGHKNVSFPLFSPLFSPVLLLEPCAKPAGQGSRAGYLQTRFPITAQSRHYPSITSRI